MPRRPMRRPRRKHTKKPRRHHRRARGKMSNNTKVDQSVVYRTTQQMLSATSITGTGQYAYAAWSPCHSSYYNITQVQEFVVQSKLFDEFCITSVKLVYRPFFNVIQPAAAGAFDINMYTFIDRDGNTPVSTAVNVPNKLQAYDSCRIHKIDKGWSRTLKLKKFWIDTTSAQINPQNNAGLAQPWINAGATQLLGAYAQNLPVPANSAIGEYTYVVRVQFRGKKTTAFGYDPVSGSVILTPITSYAPLPPQNLPVSETVVESADEMVECGVGGLVITSNYDGTVATA